MDAVVFEEHTTLVELGRERFTTLIIDPSIRYPDDRPFYCLVCLEQGLMKMLFKINRKFATIADGVGVMGGSGLPTEVPLNILRMTRMCGSCRHYYIIYFDGSGGI